NLVSIWIQYILTRQLYMQVTTTSFQIFSIRIFRQKNRLQNGLVLFHGILDGFQRKSTRRSDSGYESGSLKAGLQATAHLQPGSYACGWFQQPGPGWALPKAAPVCMGAED